MGSLAPTIFPRVHPYITTHSVENEWFGESFYAYIHIILRAQGGVWGQDNMIPREFHIILLLLLAALRQRLCIILILVQ